MQAIENFGQTLPFLHHGGERRGKERRLGIVARLREVRHAETDQAHGAPSAFGPFAVEEREREVPERDVVARWQLEARLARDRAERAVPQLQLGRLSAK